jgi:nucleoside-diphosphate-sugar epimerase
VPKTLITGAAGGVAQQLRPGLIDHDLRVTDVRSPGDWGTAESVTGNLSDRAFARDVVDGTDAIVHLAANPAPSARWDELQGPNVDAVVSLLEAARDLGVRRVVLASSAHTMVGHLESATRPISPHWPTAPCCNYGASKVFAESMGRVIATTSATTVVCLRLGACTPTPPSRSDLGGWLGPADLHRLVRAALTADVRFGTYFGVSANTPAVFDLSNARRELGYQPTLDSADYDHDLPDGGDDFGHNVR